MSDDDDDRGVRVLRVPHLFFKILCHTTLEATVSLYLALPPAARDLCFRPDYYARLVRLQDLRRTDGVRLQLVAGDEVDFVSYVKFRHLHLHGLAMPRSALNSACYVVDAYRSHPMLPHQREMVVVDCLFLPATAPGRLSNNLVVLCAGGEFLCYAPGDFCFRLTASSVLRGMESQAHSLVSSPLGTRLLVVGERYTCYIKLAEDGLLSLLTRIPERILKCNFGSHCFVDESSFLTMDTVNHHLLTKWTYSEVSETMVRRVWLKVRLPLLGGLDPPKSLVYKRRTENTPDCLILSARPRGLAQGNRLGLVVDFFGGRETPYKEGGSLDFYEVNFRSCVVADHVVHPDQERVYVGVVTRLSRKDFFAHVPPTVEECLLPDGFVVGTGAVYELTFGAGGRMEVRPKFYLDMLERDERVGVFADNWGAGQQRLYHFAMSQEPMMKLQCGRHTLTVKLNSNVLAHIPLVSGPDSTVCYLRPTGTYGHFVKFCFSTDHSFGAVFRGYLALSNSFMWGLKLCPVYNNFSGDENKINLRGLEVLRCSPC
jgi:hypothetical protein